MSTPGPGASADRDSTDGGLQQERSLSRRIGLLVAVATLLLVGQSAYNLWNLDNVDGSIDAVNSTAGRLEELAREITTAVAQAHILSMEAALAPNRARLKQTSEQLKQQVDLVDARLEDWQQRHERRGDAIPGRTEFQSIRSAWRDYREAIDKTSYYLERGIRVAAFISVTEEEKLKFDGLQAALAAYGRTLRAHSQRVYDDAQQNSQLAFYTLLVTGLFQVVILLLILVYLYRMFRAYMKTAQEHEQELFQLVQAAEAANQAKSAFLANMSHELRTPMNAILGYSEMLMEEAEDDEEEELLSDLKKINQAGVHLLALINDVLDLSKIESGKMEAFGQEFDLDAWIDQLVDTATPLFAPNNNEFVLERGAELGSAFQDVTKLRQSLLNMLSNASKFTRNGRVTLSIEREHEAGNDWLRFSVQDTGIGIAPEKLEHIFEEFSQADDSTTRDFGGTGLGLAISRRFARMLGGDLTVASELGTGSAFTIRVPAYLPQEEAHLEPPTEPVAPVPAAGRPADRTDNTVLVIDDDPEASEIIRRYLEKDGFDVVVAQSGHEGLRLAHELRPAIITLDVLMPEMDGWSVLQALKVDPVLHETPVVMLTMVDDASRGYALGATDYLLKPIDRDRLHQLLMRYQQSEAGERVVLLVEDDADTREVTGRMLRKAGWDVMEATNGKEALALLSERRPRLVLLDLMMPVMDGFEFLLAMRANTDYKEIPVVVVTAKELSEEERVALSGKVEEVISKSAHSRTQLLERIRQAVRAAPAESTRS